MKVAPADSSGMLRGRDAEISMLGKLLCDATGGVSGALVLRGEPGIGKTALLTRTLELAADAGFRALRCVGVEIEAELAFSGLTMLLRPALGALKALPEPQRSALGAALGVASGGAPDPLFVGLAVLTLLDTYAGEQAQPLLCVIDDAHWLDGPSAQALIFAARRLGNESVIMLFATREGEGGALSEPGLPSIRLEGLTPVDAAGLLDAHVPDLRPDLRVRVLAEAGGNPLALRELPLAFATDAAATTGPSIMVPLTDRLSQAFHGQVNRLPGATQTLLLSAAAEESGDLDVILRAARSLGAGAEDIGPAETAGLVHSTQNELTFRHPLIRAVVYQRAQLADRLAAHKALAAALGTNAQADRRTWHLATAAVEPDEALAAALERTADRAGERSGIGAARFAYERAARLTPSEDERARRMLLAADAALDAGDPHRARELARDAVRKADCGASPTVRAHAIYIRAAADFAQGAFAAAHPLLLESADLAASAQAMETAASTLFIALHSAWYISEEHVRDILARIRALDLSPTSPTAPIIHFIDAALSPAPTDAAPLTARPFLPDALAASAAVGQVGAQELRMACAVALVIGQDTEAYDLSLTLAEGFRRRGELGSLLPVAFFQAETELFLGRAADSLQTATEALTIAHESGHGQWTSQLEGFLALLGALAGDEAASREHANHALTGGIGGSKAPGTTWAEWSLGLLDLTTGRPERALERFELLTRPPTRHHVAAIRAVPDLVEAAVRAGVPDRAISHFNRYEQWAQSVGQPWSNALVLRCKALLARPGPEADAHFAAALELHTQDRRSLEHGRTELLFGERLRRDKRKTEARLRLSAALELFERHGARGWARQARLELEAAGGRSKVQAPPSRSDKIRTELTPQELQIARLAAQGLPNRDIAAQLFLSPRTVEHHLYKAYPKLGIVSRAELASIAGIGA